MEYHHVNSEEESYWARRERFMYYQYIKFMVKALGDDAKSLLDVGSSNAEYVESFNWIANRYALDINKPYQSGNVKGIQMDFMEFQPTERFDFVTCLQVLEHIQDPVPFVKKLFEVGKRVLISVPYMWRENSEEGHIHDPVDLGKVISWIGKNPDYHIIVEEPLFNSTKNRRLICYYHSEGQKFNMNKLRQGLLMGNLQNNDKNRVDSNFEQINKHLLEINEHLIGIREEQERQSKLISIDSTISINVNNLTRIKDENERISSRISNYKKEIKKTEKKYKLSLLQKKKYERVYEDIINSKSWRYTKPLRDIRLILQRK
ncbi:methyltransferase domain-containing protein [Paenibacillus sp. ACRRY]|uniref:class I SAM-dependent methyltransferase n=1 Tax=Paenibacillus sp. ACRRY TaxID=2918208 RepID=UPI001EF4FDF4|nr:methyltransferase domain-containing protein [Paenibacillus sp. ACRRY]MCG7384151.1 class I SAM-dependent methyltransferase [Paenibacillus sp. ACRRY]